VSDDDWIMFRERSPQGYAIRYRHRGPDDFDVQVDDGDGFVDADLDFEDGFAVAMSCLTKPRGRRALEGYVEDARGGTHPVLVHQGGDRPPRILVLPRSRTLGELVGLGRVEILEVWDDVFDDDAWGLRS